MNLENYMDDGANPQAQATLAFLRHFNIEQSWDSDRKHYRAEIKVARWENCREQGYVLSLKHTDANPVGEAKQLNIAFFEHRNSDSICAIKWEQWTWNSPTIDTAEFGDVYKTKFDVSHSVGYGQAVEMAEWVKEQFTAFWLAGVKQ